MPKENHAVLLLIVMALRSRLVLRGEGAQARGLQGHRKLKNCRNVSPLAFVLELQLIWVARACTERAGLMKWPDRNPLLRDKGEVQRPVRDDTRLKNCLICVGHTCTAAETTWFLRKVVPPFPPSISNFYPDWHQAPFGQCSIKRWGITPACCVMIHSTSVFKATSPYFGQRLFFYICRSC